MPTILWAASSVPEELVAAGQIAFDHEPLEKVAAEFNRYAPKPIEIVTPGLQKLEISGVFATDDPAAFIAFLRSMEGVQVEETATRFRVSRDHR